MKLALSLGRRGQGLVWPNPAVGCVIVRDGVIVGRGWTQPGGRPHAEPVALQQAAEAARGATAYVTLEPCAHFGKTPPCSAALIKAGVSRVVAALQDSDPRVSGKGFDQLRAAGISVTTGVMAQEAAQDHAGFFSRIEQNRPFVTLKLALSLDGRIATGTGDSQWITGAQARRRVHLMRARHDAVLVGAGTARADDPSLTQRDLGLAHQPVRVVAARRLDVPENSVLARTARDHPVWLLQSDAPKDRRDYWSAQGAEVLDCAGQGDALDPRAMMAVLAGRGITRVFCEGGGALAASLLKAGLVDDLVVHSAGVAIGADGVPGLAAMGHSLLREAPRYELAQMRQLGNDTEQIWQRITSAS